MGGIGPFAGRPVGEKLHRLLDRGNDGFVITVTTPVDAFPAELGRIMWADAR